MKTLCLPVLLLAVIVLGCESHPGHGRHEKSHDNLKKRLQEAGIANLTIHHEKVGHKRFIGGIIAAFTLFNDLADFMGRVNNVVGWFDNIDRFMGSGGTESESEVNVAEINELKTRLDGLATDVENGFKSLLAGGEYTDVLNIVANDVEKLQLIDGYQREYLAEVKRYKELPAGERNSEEMAASEDSWFESIDARDDHLEDALGSLRLQVCGKPLLTQTSLYEAYAWKHGQQSTGSVESLMEFISRVRLLEANGYAVRMNFVKKKYKDDTARKNIEVRKINTRMEQTKTCEDPAIAKAMSRMVDHQGIPAFGRIRWSHSHHNSSSRETYDRCLTYETSSGEAEPEARSCSTTAQNQQWKLKADNTLRPRNDQNKCLFLIEPEETRGASFSDYGYKVLPCSSSYNNKKFTFEYLSHQRSGENKLHTFFKLKAKNDNFDRPGWQGQDICLAFRASGGYVGTTFDRWVPQPFRCTCPPITNELHWCIGEYPPSASDNEYPWFKFEPVE
ncbi:unnamed protein product [Pocillopora meandrina]|uniref:Uncharacterized protein n=1 Tax=Pocillopora meandrina TaxID=46732 RepID=A0AAU9XKL4_9CNID|nr:unnamed protein product [Pocillopora meandrina]